MALQYVSLHNHCTFSIFDALGFPEDYYRFVLSNGGDGIALTDHGNMNGLGYAVSAAKGLKTKGTKFRPIYGVEAYFIPSIAQWHAIKSGDDLENNTVVEDENESKNNKFYDPLKRRHHLVIFALNNTGLQNLFTLVSLSYRRENFYRFPRMDLDMLRKHSDGLAISTSCIAGIVAWCVQHPAFQGLTPSLKMRFLDQEVQPLLDIFGRDRAFLELQFNGLDVQKQTNEQLIAYAQHSGYKLIVASDAHYCRPDLWKEREIYKALGRSMMSSNFDITQIPQAIVDLKCELYPHNAQQIFDAYKKYNPTLDESLVKDAINRTHDIAWHLVGDVQPDSTYKLPAFVSSSPDVSTPFQELKRLCKEALIAKGIAHEPYLSRAVYELQIIKDKGVAAYFLTKKAILDCLRKELLLGVGRGSGAGSLVNYLLDITLADPIKGGLLFERFMSPSRAEMPDIDSDIEDKDIGFELLKKEFGEQNVLAISNYNRLTLKTLVKDVARLYNIPFEESNQVTKAVEVEARPLIMMEIGNDQKLYELTYEKAYEHSTTFKKFIDKYPHVGECLSNLHKSIKAISRHAGGILIVPDAEKHLPIIRVKNVYQSPFSEGLTAQHLKHFGLIKFDVLGLSTLRIIRRCIELILQSQGIDKPTMRDVQDWYNKHLHPDVIDPADQKVFENVYHQGKFLSTFQFAEPGVQSFCTKAKPRSVKDLSAISSTWRPGALSSQGDQKYLDFDPKAFKREHPIIQEVLGETRGVLILQEQFMLLAHKLAGFSLDEADKLRKLLVKPSNELGDELKKQRNEAGEKFIKGAIAQKMPAKRAHDLWHNEIMPFVSYGFNKCLRHDEPVHVYSKDGQLLKTVPIREIKAGDCVRSRCEVTGEDILVSVNHNHANGKRDVVKVTLDNGTTMHCTLDHKFRTQSGAMIPLWMFMQSVEKPVFRPEKGIANI